VADNILPRMSVSRDDRRTGPMTARRILAGFALLMAAAGAAACAQVVPGTGTIAADARAGGGGPTGSSSPSSTDSTESTSPSSPSPSPSGSGGTSPVCQALDEGAVEEAFGTSVTFSRSQSSGCQIRADDGRSMIVAVFDYLKLSEYKKAGTTQLEVGGYPAIRTTTTIIYVGRSMDPDTEGLLAAYFSGLRDGGDAIAVKVLEQLIKKYAK
jgi:ABC-type phosphate transport system substrate-binding protein